MALTSLCEKCLWFHLWHRAAMCSTEMLFSNFVQCMGAARSSCLLPLSIAFLRKKLPRAPHLGRFGHAAVHLELLMEGSQLPSNLRGFPFPLCPDFSEKGKEDLLVPYSTSPSDAGAAHRGKPAVCRKETGFMCHHAGAEGNPGQKSQPLLDQLTSLPLGQSQRGGCHGGSLSISV